MLAKLHPKNSRRLEVLRDLDVLDSGPEKIYDELTDLTAEICETPVCLVSLVDKDRQWFKSRCGLKVDETPVESSVCAHAINEESFLEIPDTQFDQRTADNPLCQGESAFRFYAGAILKTLDGWPLGTLCVLDYKPRKLNQVQRHTLEVHANNVAKQIELTKVLMDTACETDLTGSSGFLTSSKMQRKFESLTPREKEVFSLIIGGSFGSSSKKIGRALEISPRTVDHHRANILSKLDVSSVAELIATSMRAGLSASE